MNMWFMFMCMSISMPDMSPVVARPAEEVESVGVSELDMPGMPLMLEEDCDWDCEADCDCARAAARTARAWSRATKNNAKHAAKRTTAILMETAPDDFAFAGIMGNLD